jgi:hypothetical protein
MLRHVRHVHSTKEKMRGGNKESKAGSSSLVHDTFERSDDDGPGPGKRSLKQQLTPELQTGSAVSVLVQRKPGSSNAGPAGSPDAVHAAAERGTAGSSTRLPFADVIQRAFGRHSVDDIQAHTDANAAAGAAAMGARAFATGNHVAFAGTPGLHTAAHEAVHVVQQRAGVHLKGGVGETGDAYERNADEVADRVVRGESAADLLPGGGSSPGSAVQRTDAGGALHRKDGKQGPPGPQGYAGQAASQATAIQRQAGPVDAGVVPLPAGVPADPLDAEPATMQDAELGQAYARALTGGDSTRAQAVDEEMDRRTGMGTAVPRGPQPVTSGSGAVTADVALSLLDNMAEGKPPFKPESGIGGCSWFTTEGNPYTSVSTDKNINVQVEIAKGQSPLVFREAELVKIFEELTEPTRAQAELEYRAKFQIPEGTPLSKRALKAINRTLDRFIEKQMWKRLGESVAASSQKVGEVVLQNGGRFSDSAGKFAVVADASKISLKGGTAPLVDALAKEGVMAEKVVAEAAEALATKMKWAGRVRGCSGTVGGC